jgi:hypothetical protein
MDPYDALCATLEQVMKEAHGLGLYRTAHVLHQALDSAQYERWEVSPSGASPSSTVTWRIGPISEQPPTKK